ncbi:MAG TPA: AAA family ATPase [Candidatus Limnocylindria bacterium]|nr:AAA family ATPase [Candidatus Limnocylindria bacterium]
MTERVKVATASGTPFVGRDAELNALLRALGDTVKARGCVALVGGEPGIGKSRLAEQLAVRARADGMRVLSGQSWEGGGAPAYWPWVQVFRTIIRTTDDASLRHQLGAGAADIAQMVVELRETFGDPSPSGSVDSESARFQMFDSATTFLRRAAKAGPMLIIIEDLHAADMPTVLYLRFVAGQLADTPIMVVCTYRDMELTADPSLAAAVGEIARLPGALSLRLGGLGEAPVRQLIEATAGVSPRSSLVNAVVRETGGNPLFLSEAVRLLAAEGRLEEVATGQALDLPLPPGIRDVIIRRVRHLPAETAELLTHAAALGPEFITEVLRRVTASAAEDVLDRIGDASRAGLVAPVPGTLGRFRFTHDLIRETLYDELTPGRRVSLHRRIADTLHALYGEEPSYHAELAYHYVEAARGGVQVDEDRNSTAELAVQYARQAGDVALGSLAYEEAARLYQMALAVLDFHAPSDSERRMEMLLRLGEAQARAGDLPASRATYLEAAQLARRHGAVETLARAALGYGGRFFWARVGNDQHLIPLLQDALLLLGATDDRLRVRLLTRLACAWRSEPERQEQRRALSQQAVDMARQLEDPATLGYALVGFFWANWLPDNAHERLAVAEEMLAVAETTGDAERTIDAHLMLDLVAMDLGRMAEAHSRMETVLKLARELRQPSHLWLTWANRTVLALMEGKYLLAEELMAHEMEPGHPTTPVQDDVSAARMHRFLLRREQGRGLEEESSVRASVDDFPWYPLHRAALVCLLAEAGRTEEARAAFDELAADDFKALYPDCEWLMGVALASEASAALGDAAAAGILYDQLLPFEGAHAIGHTEGSMGAVDRYLGMLAATLGRYSDAERHFESGIVVNEKLGARPWVAHTQADLAVVLRKRGARDDLGRAEALERVALQTARELGMSALEDRLRRTHDDAGPADSRDGSERTTDDASKAAFRREGEYWTVTFDGSTMRMRDAKGMHHLARLLAAPGREIHALDLAGTGSTDAGGVAVAAADVGGDPFGALGPALDDTAKQGYRARLRELEEEAAEAEAWNDTERAARARGEMDALVGELASAVGLGGRNRTVGSASERARISVTRAIRSSVARIAQQNPELGRHFEATIRTGTYCSYQPDPRAPLEWRL